MSDFAEGLGQAIEGTLTAKAVEPDHAPLAQPTDTETCPNCGAQASGAFCWNCGQKLHVHRTLGAIAHDLMHGVLHLDGKLFNTLPLLTFKPGKLTKRYIEGERAKFVSPMAMFLFSVFAMFAVFQIAGIKIPWDLNESVNLEQTAQVVREQGEKEAADLRATIAAMDADDPMRAEREQQLAMLEGLLNSTDETAAEDARQDGASDDEIDLRDAELEVNLTGIESIDQGIIKKWRENPSLMLYKVQANGYKFSWLLIPLSIPFVWLLFAWKRRFNAYDHAIFVTYSLSFMSLLFIAVSLIAISPMGAGWIFPILAIGAPLHIYKHLRHAYDLSRFSTIWRLFLLLVFIVIVILLFVQALILIGAF